MGLIKILVASALVGGIAVVTFPLIKVSVKAIMKQKIKDRLTELVNERDFSEKLTPKKTDFSKNLPNSNYPVPASFEVSKNSSVPDKDYPQKTTVQPLPEHKKENKFYKMYGNLMSLYREKMQKFSAEWSDAERRGDVIQKADMAHEYLVTVKNMIMDKVASTFYDLPDKERSILINKCADIIWDYKFKGIKFVKWAEKINNSDKECPPEEMIAFFKEFRPVFEHLITDLDRRLNEI